MAPRTLTHTKQRIFDLMVTPGISCRMLFYFAPVAVRRLFMSEQEASCSPVQARPAPHAQIRNNRLATCPAVHAIRSHKVGAITAAPRRTSPRLSAQAGRPPRCSGVA